MLCRQALTVAKPQTALFLEPLAYDWVAMDEFAVSSFYAGNKQEGLRMSQKLLQNPLLPDIERPRVEENIRFYQGVPKVA